MKRNREVRNSSVPLPLCIFFVLFLGAFSVFFCVGIPNKIQQYNTRENLIENGEVVNAEFDYAYKNGQTNGWYYVAVFSYVDDRGNNYLLPIKSGQDTDIDALNGETVKIKIDGKGNCIKADTTENNLLTDIILYAALCLLFLCLWIPFIVILIIKFRYFAYQRKLKREELVYKTSIFK